MNLLENVNVFCISPAGVTEVGSQLLTLITCRPSSSSPHHSQLVKQVKRRLRTSSLPSEFEDDLSFSKYASSSSSPSNSNGFSNMNSDHGGHKKTTTATPHQILRRSLSDYVLRGRGAESLEEVCRECIRSMVRFPKRSRSQPRKKKCQGVTTCQRKRGRVASCKALVGQRHHHKTGLQSPGTAFKVDGYMLSYFIAEIKRSHPFRMACIEHWSSQGGIRRGPKVGQNLLVMVALMSSPKSEVLDLLGNKMVNSNILFRRSLEHALSWLSTLGGAFSALGDLSAAWAEEAGHVSLTQLRISLKLGDPGIQSRCRLYAAISLLQRGFLRSCRDIVRNEYQYAMSLPEGADPRLRRMCLGVWAKLQYHWKLATSNDKKGLFKSTSDGLENIRNNAKYWNVYDLEENRKLVQETAVEVESFL